jgi:hypothetical protein
MKLFFVGSSLVAVLVTIYLFPLQFGLFVLRFLDRFDLPIPITPVNLDFSNGVRSYPAYTRKLFFFN